MTQRAIILFDGVCNLCNNAVQFIIKRDAEKYFAFASLQSGFAKKILSETDLATDRLSSIVLIENGKIYLESTAALKIGRHLNKGWKIMAVFLYIIPKFIRDAAYRFIARHRYQWFGKRNDCMIPTPSLKERFLE